MKTNSVPEPLLGRPEPQFVEGRRPPRPTFREWVIWTSLVIGVAVSVVVACLVDMVVQVPAAGLILSYAGPSPSADASQPKHQVVLTADPKLAQLLAPGQPVRLLAKLDASEPVTGWGLVTAWDAGPAHLSIVVELIGPATLLVPRGPVSCQAHVLVGYVPTMRGLWLLATQRPAQRCQRDMARLHRKIPLPWRDRAAELLKRAEARSQVVRPPGARRSAVTGIFSRHPVVASTGLRCACRADST